MDVLWIVFIIFLYCYKPSDVNGEDQVCRNYSVIANDDKHYTLIGLFPAYISSPAKYSPNGLMYMEIVKYVLSQFNKVSPFKVGYRFYDTCGESQLQITTDICLDVLLKSNLKRVGQQTCSCSAINHLDYVIGAVGPASSSVSQTTSNFFLPAMLPLISYASTSVKLNDQEKFPYFLRRTISADDYQIKVIFDLVSKFNWKYVSLLASDNLYGRSGSDILLDLFKKNGICFAVNKLFKVPYDQNEIDDLVKSIQKEKKAEVVIIWALKTPSRMILQSAERLKLYRKTWIFTEGVGDSRGLLKRQPSVVRGAFSIIPVSGYSPEFEQYFFNLTYPEETSTYVGKPWLRKFFHKYVEANKTVGDAKDRFYPHKIGIVWNGVNAYLTALTDFVKDHGNSSVPFPSIYNRTLFFYQYLKKVHFKSLGGDLVDFDEKGNIRNPRYKVLNVNANDTNVWFQEIGDWKESTGLKFNGVPIMWADKKQPKSHCSGICPAGRYPFQSDVPCCWNCVNVKMDLLNPIVVSLHAFDAQRNSKQS